MISIDLMSDVISIEGGDHLLVTPYFNDVYKLGQALQNIDKTSLKYGESRIEVPWGRCFLRVLRQPNGLYRIQGCFPVEEDGYQVRVVVLDTMDGDQLKDFTDRVISVFDSVSPSSYAETVKAERIKAIESQIRLGEDEVGKIVSGIFELMGELAGLLDDSL